MASSQTLLNPTNISPAILNIALLPHFSSLRHIAVHTLSPLALWYWCNMHIQLLSFKYVCHKELEPKSAAASWNATSSCLLSSHLLHDGVNCACELHYFMNFWRYRSRCWWRPLHTLLELLLTSKSHVTWIISKVNSIAMHCSLAYEIVLSLAQCLKLQVQDAVTLSKKQQKNAFLLRILKLPRTRMWQPRNPYLTCISCMLTWPD